MNPGLHKLFSQPSVFEKKRLSFLDHKHLTGRGRENLALVALAGACIALIVVIGYA